MTTTPDEAPRQDPDPLDDAAASAPGPRAFVTATGFVYQIVGAALCLSGCCLWSLSGWFQNPFSAPVESLGDYVENLVGTLGMVAMVATALGGFGLFAAGLGLQGEHPASGTVAMVVSGILAVVWWASAIGLLLLRGEILAIVIAGLLALGNSVLFMLAGNSARILVLHPPPPDRSLAPEDYRDPLGPKQ